MSQGTEIAIGGALDRREEPTVVDGPRALRRRWARHLAHTLGGALTTVLVGTVIPVALLGLWQLAARREWISQLVLPAPATVLQTFRELWADGTIGGNLIVSAARVAKGFALGAGLGLVVGTALGLSTAFRAYIRPTFVSLYQVNVLGWIPLLILVFGIDEALKVVVIAWATLLPVAINTAQGISGIPARWFELARVCELRKRQIVWRIACPAALPSIFTGLRGGLGAAWMSLVVVELVASSEGVGFMIVWGRQLFQLDVVLAAIVVVGVVGLTLDLGLRAVEARLRRWHGAPS